MAQIGDLNTPVYATLPVTLRKRLIFGLITREEVFSLQKS
jgi:hypothetical protein